MITKKHIRPGFIILLFILAQCTGEKTDVDTLPFTFEDTLTLGTNDENAPIHETFRTPTHVVSDEGGRLYIVDAGEISVRVYHENGEFRQQFGSEGEGPGEFRALSHLYIDSRNRLLVVDALLSRITALTLDGGFLQSWELPSITRTSQVSELSDGRFALVGQHNGHLVHILDADFSAIEASLMAVEDLITTNEREERVFLQFRMGSITLLPDDSVVYAPPLYTGELYVYRMDESGSWALAETIQGYQRHGEPASFSTFENARRADFPIFYPDEGRYAIQFHSFSQGVFYMEEAGLVHYSYQETDNNHLALIAESFNPYNAMAGIAAIDTLEALAISVLNMDEHGHVYVSDGREFSKLRRLQISGF